MYLFIYMKPGSGSQLELWDVGSVCVCELSKSMRLYMEEKTSLEILFNVSQTYFKQFYCGLLVEFLFLWFWTTL